MPYINPKSALAQNIIPKDSLLYGDVLQNEIQAKILTGQLVRPVRPAGSHFITNTSNVLHPTVFLMSELGARGYEVAFSSDPRNIDGSMVSGLAVTVPDNKGRAQRLHLDVVGLGRNHPARDLLYDIWDSAYRVRTFAIQPALVGDYYDTISQTVKQVFPESVDIRLMVARSLLSTYALGIWHMDIPDLDFRNRINVLTEQYQALREQTGLVPFTAEELGGLAAKAVTDAIKANPGIPKPTHHPVPIKTAFKRGRYGQSQ